MTHEQMLEILHYALWCFGSYGLVMGSFLYNTASEPKPLTRGHIIVAFFVSSFGVYSFIYAAVRSLLLHQLTFPLSWNMKTGTVIPRS